MTVCGRFGQSARDEIYLCTAVSYVSSVSYMICRCNWGNMYVLKGSLSDGAALC